MVKKKRSRVNATFWAGAQNARPEELTGLDKWRYEDQMGIVPAKYIHEKVSLSKIPEGYVNRSRRPRTEKEYYLQQLADSERNAIETGAKTWAEIPKATQKVMEEWLSNETIAKLKAAKDEGLRPLKGLMFIFTTAQMLDRFGCSTAKELHIRLNRLRKHQVVHYWVRFEDDESYLVAFSS